MHKTSAFLTVGFLLLTSAFAQAREVKYKDVSVDLHEGDRLVIVGLKGSVKLSTSAKSLVRGATENLTQMEGSAGNTLIRARKTGGAQTSSSFDQWTFSIRRDGNQVRVEAKGPDAKSDWQSQMKNDSMPEMHFDIEAPAVPVDIAFRQGSVSLQGWKAGASVQLVDGQLRVAKNEGALKAQVQKGEVKIEGQKGRTDIDGFSSKMILSQIEGELTLDNFSGESSVHSLKGHLQVHSFSGQTAVTGADGGVDFQVGRGTLNYQGSGGVRGKLDNGVVVAKVTGEPDINIEAQEGSVNLDIDNAASPSVRMQSEDGNISSIGDLPSSRLGSGRLVAGRLNGGGQGSVIVKTKSGNVRLY